MEYFKICGGKKLSGQISVHGAKNSALPILASTLLIKGESVIHNCPDLSDVRVTLDILKSLGCKVKREKVPFLLMQAWLIITKSASTLCALCARQ